MALAAQLNMPFDQVRLSQGRPPPNVIMGALPDLFAGPRGFVSAERHERMQTYMVMRHGGAPPLTLQIPHRPPLDLMIVVGDFSAAAHLPDGRWLVVSSPPDPFPSDWQIRVSLWIGGCLLILGLAAWLFSRRITAPIIAFAAAAERLGRDPRGGAIPLKGPAEIGKAAAAFNRMQERLKRYVDDRTAMVAAISHDMRTPLARIRFKLEDAPEAVRVGVTRDVERMEGMIDAVLAFVRDASEPSRRERLDLRSLVEVVADETVGACTPVEVTGAERPVVVDADPAALTRLFANLVDNALKHGKGARIIVTSDDEHAVVDVLDDGPGVPEGELERVFQPFYRADPARTLTRDGVGLGLAVARSIARAHGGDITLIPRTPTGLTARVTLPLAAKR
jgi:signal transduction histidine kinase